MTQKRENMNSEKNEISEQNNVGIDESSAEAFTGRMLDILTLQYVVDNL